MNAKRLTMDAMLAALCAVLAAVSITIFGNLKLTLENLPVLVGALFFGPVDGMLIGGIGSFLYQLLFSGYGLTVTTPLWILPYVVSGLVAGLLGHKGKLKDSRIGLLTILIIDALIVTFFNTLALYADSKLFGYYSKPLVFGGLIWKIVIGIVKSVAYAFLFPALFKLLRKAGIGKEGNSK